MLIVLGIAGFVVWKMSSKADSAPKFKTIPVKKGNIEEVVEASGPIAPITTTQVGALVSGEILKIYVIFLDFS